MMFSSGRLALLVLSALLAACDRPTPPPQPPRPALVVTVGAATSPVSATLVGEVRSRYESAQGFRIPGKIIERKAEVGSPVKKGQVIARLDATDTDLSAHAAQAQVVSAEAELALARSELERQHQLYVKKFISAAALDVREAQFKTSEARVQQARAQAAVAGNQSRYTALIADRDGVITEIRAEPGQVVEAGEVVVHIAAGNALEVAVAVPESRMAGLVAGMPVEVRLWAHRETLYPGKVREIAPAADSVTRTFQVRVAVPAPDSNMRLGMTAGVSFAGSTETPMLLPSAAVTQLNGHTVAWVVDPATQRVQPRVVQTGPFREDGIEIKQGLTSGEAVVVAGVHALVPGQLVRPIPAGAVQ